MWVYGVVRVQASFVQDVNDGLQNALGRSLSHK